MHVDVCDWRNYTMSHMKVLTGQIRGTTSRLLIYTLLTAGCLPLHFVCLSTVLFCHWLLTCLCLVTMIGRWHDYLSASRCNWFVYWLVYATVTPSILASLKARIVCLFDPGLLMLLWKRGHQMGLFVSLCPGVLEQCLGKLHSKCCY